MSDSAKTIEFRFERTIQAPREEVFDAWLDPAVPGNPWNIAEKYILDPRVDGLFFWTVPGVAHYGRFIEFRRPSLMRHTWLSRYTLGEETTVTVSFEPKGGDTLMTLVHSGLPDHELARAHKEGWESFLTDFREQFGAVSRRESRRAATGSGRRE